jgi:BirA family biotin operon repressor/biotin-[acetyl-CoA-carboxylase] ligase
MKSVFFNQLPSTQTYLIEHLSSLITEDPDVIVSCQSQSAGLGRRANVWHHFEGSLAFSCTIRPSSIIGLTSLELGCLLIQFFRQYETTLALKWPNDIFNTKGEKCGGLLCQLIEGIVVAGIGLNMGELHSTNLLKNQNYPIGSISLSDKIDPQEIYLFFLKNRLTSQEIVSEWNKHCFHIGRNVTIQDDEKKYQGIFIGIGEQGQAQLKTSENKFIELFSGNLFLH